MTTLIPFLSAGDVTYSAQVRPLQAPGQPLHVRISSRHSDARHPQAERTQFEMTLSRHEYEALLAILRGGSCSI
ncbi:MAG: hypothetical protein J0I00_04235 [Burkholderiales bacterium]|nr:hypothetical protein [Burkholderiales bacterium]MBS0415956.1 hypothetical protein [Pseudomonadota bacterium]MCO5114746.1 hypothetical protein [Burkholderiaceae bacterium]MCP5218867.1 hypothetical protein [Burkholderiaceae bacterium]